MADREGKQQAEKIALKCVHLQLQTLTINADSTRGGFFQRFSLCLRLSACLLRLNEHFRIVVTLLPITSVFG